MLPVKGAMKGYLAATAIGTATCDVGVPTSPIMHRKNDRVTLFV